MICQCLKMNEIAYVPKHAVPDSSWLWSSAGPDACGVSCLLIPHAMKMYIGGTIVSIGDWCVKEMVNLSDDP